MKRLAAVGGCREFAKDGKGDIVTKNYRTERTRNK